MEILNLRSDGAGGYIANGLTAIQATDPLVVAWLAANKEVMPAYTAAEAAAVLDDSRWALVEQYGRELTITIAASGHKFAANTDALTAISLKIGALGTADTITWIESWATFTTNKVELQEVLTLAEAAKQTFTNTTFGV